MKIVIDMTEDFYELLMDKEQYNYIRETNLEYFVLVQKVKNGTILPKGHGRLIDTNDLEDFCQTHKVVTSDFDGELIYDAGSTSRGDTIWKPLLNELKPIIEAESEEEE